MDKYIVQSYWSDMSKIIRCISSCKTLEQLEVARCMLPLFREKHACEEAQERLQHIYYDKHDELTGKVVEDKITLFTY